jgi:hypothetical protein
MANLKDSPKFKIHDDYYTPKYAWEKINHLIPKDKVVWEACMLNSNLSSSPEYLIELGNKVVYDTSWNILKENHGDIIITNPPFETKIKSLYLGADFHRNNFCQSRTKIKTIPLLIKKKI